MKLHLTASAVALAALALAGCQSVQEKDAPNTVVAAKVAAAPDMKALASDPSWAKARPLAIEVSDGANFGGTAKSTGSLKAVYTADTLYMHHTRHDAKTEPNAGRKNEDKQGDYTPIPLVNGKPQFMNRDGKAGNAGGTYGVKRGEEVQFADPKTRYPFGFAAFDNAQVRHATTDDALFLVFGK